MRTFIGVKVVKAVFEEAPEPTDNNPLGQPGYIVVYDNGYKSWSPEDVFEAAYVEVEGDDAAKRLERARMAAAGISQIAPGGHDPDFEKRIRALQIAHNPDDEAKVVLERSLAYANFLDTGKIGE